MHAYWHLGSRFQSMQLDPFQEKTGRWTILPAPSVLTHSKSWASLNNFSSVCCKSPGSWECNPHWFSELDILRSHPLVRVINVWALNVGVQTDCSWERSLELGVPSQLYGTMLGVGFVARLCLSLSYPFQCGYLLNVLESLSWFLDFFQR